MNIILKIQVPKEIPDWFKCEEEPLKDGFIIDKTNIFGIKIPLQEKLDELSAQGIYFSSSEDLITKCPFGKEYLGQINYATEYMKRIKIKEYEQWQTYYITKFVNEHKPYIK